MKFKEFYNESILYEKFLTRKRGQGVFKSFPFSIYINATPKEIKEIVDDNPTELAKNEFRLGVDGKGNVLFWSAEFLHDEVETLLKRSGNLKGNFIARFNYLLKTFPNFVQLSQAGPNSKVRNTFSFEFNIKENIKKKIIKNLKKAFPKIKEISDVFGDSFKI